MKIEFLTLKWYNSKNYMILIQTLLIIFSIFCFSLWGIQLVFTADKTVKDLKIPKKQFVIYVLEWCSLNLGKLKHDYNLEIKYHKDKVYGGIYIPYSRTIRIFVHNELPIIDLTENIIHEYVHYLQNNKKGTDVEYNKHLHELGYWNNPFEIEARKLSAKYKDQCYRYVTNSYRII